MPGILCRDLVTWFFMIQELKIQWQEHIKVILILGCYFDCGENYFSHSVFHFTNRWWVTWHDPHFSELHLENSLVILAFKVIQTLRNSKLIISRKSSKNFFCCCLGFVWKPYVRECSAKWCAGRRGCVPSLCVSLLGFCRPKGWCNILKLMELFPLASMGSIEVGWEEAAWPRLEHSLVPSGISLWLQENLGGCGQVCQINLQRHIVIKKGEMALNW